MNKTAQRSAQDRQDIQGSRGALIVDSLNNKRN